MCHIKIVCTVECDEIGKLQKQLKAGQEQSKNILRTRQDESHGKHACTVLVFVYIHMHISTYVVRCMISTSYSPM